MRKRTDEETPSEAVGSISSNEQLSRTHGGGRDKQLSGTDFAGRDREHSGTAGGAGRDGKLSGSAGENGQLSRTVGGTCKDELQRR